MEKIESQTFDDSAPEKENNKEIFLLDEIETYRESENISKIIKDIHNKWLQENPNKMGVFDSKFQLEYVKFKIKLVDLIKINRNFFEDPKRENIDEIRNKYDSVDSSIIFPSEEYEKYIDTKEKVENILYNLDHQDIFKQFSGGNSSIGELDFDIYGNCLVLKCYEDEDYFLLWDSEKVEKTGGFYENKKTIKYEGQEIDVPFIAVRSKISDKIYDEITDLNGQYIQDDYMKEFYEMETGLNSEDEEGNLTDEYNEWGFYNSGRVFDNYVIKIIEDDISDSEDLDYETEKAIENYLFRVGEISDHEKQHHNYSNALIEYKDLKIKIDTEHQLEEYFKNILDSYFIRLGDELIAYMKDAVNHSKHFNSGYKNAFGGYYELEDNEQEEKDEIENDILKIELSEALYFYPKDYKEEILKDIKEKIGDNKFKEWNVVDKYNNEVLLKFLHKKKKLENTTTKIIRSWSSERVLKIIDLLEVEPVKNWLMIYRWIKNNSSVRDLIFED